MGIRVIVADDHTLFRTGLTRMLGSFDGVRIVAEAANGDEVLARIKEHKADLLMLDLSMPGASGVSLIERVRKAMPALPILVLSMHDEPALVKQSLKAGASGYITKDVTPETLSEAIAKVGQGGRYVAPAIAESLAFDFDEDADTNPVRQLTARELEILNLIAVEGLSLVQIAEKLDLSPKTITTHKTNIMSKLGVSTNLELIRYVVDHQPFD